MLIEQIIEFKLRGLGPLNRTCTPTTGYFHVKTKISKKIFEWIIYYYNTYKNLTPNRKITNVFSTKL